VTAGETRWVTTTVATGQAADELARGVVAARLAACAQVMGPVESTYWWRDEIESAQEWQVVFKTSADRYRDLERYVLDHHSDDVPEILCLPVVGGHQPYLTWVAEQTRPPSERAPD
jgi:periplasmic divalent cation tolerance protein